MKTLDLFQLRGKVALVTGGAGIVGKFLVRGLAEAGATVMVASRNAASCEAVAAEMQAENLTVFPEQCDFTSEAEIRALRQRLLDQYGRVDVLFNNAVARSGGELMDTSLDEWESVMALNSTGLFLSCRLFGEAMMERKSGSIVNVASIYGMVGPDFSSLRGHSDPQLRLLRLCQRRNDQFDPVSGKFSGASWRPGEYAIARRRLRGSTGSVRRELQQTGPDGATGQRCGPSGNRRVSGVRRFGLHHGPEYCRGWRLDRDMKSFSALDYTAVVLYLLAIAAFGSSFYRRNSTAREYFLGNRSMSWLPAGISIIAADLSAISVMGAPAWAYKNNLEMLWVAVGYPLVAPLVVLVFVPFYSSLNLYTAYEYLERRFSLGVRLFSSGLFQLLRSWHVAVALYGPALVINMVTGMAVWKCVLVMGVFTTFYTTLGGIKAVIWTDVIQFCTVTSGIIVILMTAIFRTPGGAAEVWRVASENGKLHFMNTSMDPTQLTTIWSCIAGGAILSLAPLTTDRQFYKDCSLRNRRRTAGVP